MGELIQGGPQIPADERRYACVDITREVIGAFYDVYNELGRGVSGVGVSAGYGAFNG